MLVLGAPLGARRHHVRALPGRPQAASRVLDDRQRRHRRSSGSAPASLLRAARRRRRGRRSRSAAALLHTLNHACQGRSSSSAPVRSSARPAASTSTRSAACCVGCRWTGGAFLVASPRSIAGLPPPQRVRLGVADPPGAPPRAGVAAASGTGTARRRRPGSARRSGRRSPCSCFVKVVGLALLGPPRRSGLRRRGRAAAAMRWALVALAGAASCSASRRGCSSRASSASRPGRPATLPVRVGLDLPGDRRPADAGDRPRRWSPSPAVLVLLRGRRVAAPRRPGRADSRSSPGSRGRAPASPSRCASCSRRCCVPSARSTSTSRGGVVQSVTYRGRVPHLIDEHVYRPVTSRRAAVAPSSRDACRAAGSARTSCYLIVARPRAAPRRPDRSRSDERRSRSPRARFRSSAGFVLAPLLLGLVQQDEGPAPGHGAARPAPALSRAAPSLGQERRRRRGHASV